MDVYIFQADIYCAACGEAAKAQCDLDGNTPDDPSDENTYDSGDYPKGPYSNGGGEADTPQHCMNCGVFLENPLTTDGYKYVKKAMRELRHGCGSREIVNLWKKFYDVSY